MAACLVAEQGFADRGKGDGDRRDIQQEAAQKTPPDGERQHGGRDQPDQENVQDKIDDQRNILFICKHADKKINQVKGSGLPGASGPGSGCQRQEDGLWLPWKKKKRLRIYGLF
jgi:hypothetical protein